MLREAAAQRDVTDAASVSAVLAFRVREMTEHLPPANRTWTERTPQLKDPDTNRCAP